MKSFLNISAVLVAGAGVFFLASGVYYETIVHVIIGFMLLLVSYSLKI